VNLVYIIIVVSRKEPRFILCLYLETVDDLVVIISQSFVGVLAGSAGSHPQCNCNAMHVTVL